MPYVGTDLPPIDPGTKAFMRIDFIKSLNPGEVPTSILSFSLVAVPGWVPDATAASRLVADTQAFDDTGAYVEIGPGCVAGVRYQLTAQIATNQSGQYELWTFFNCEANPAL